MPKRQTSALETERIKIIFKLHFYSTFANKICSFFISFELISFFNDMVAWHRRKYPVFLFETKLRSVMRLKRNGKKRKIQEITFSLWNCVKPSRKRLFFLLFHTAIVLNYHTELAPYEKCWEADFVNVQCTRVSVFRTKRSFYCRLFHINWRFLMAYSIQAASKLRRCTWHY